VVGTAVKRLKNGKFPGNDSITNNMIKAGGTNMIQLLYLLYSSLWRWTSTPTQWRAALIKPIYKGQKMDKQDPASYRGIALSSSLSNFFESILDARLAIFTHENNTCTQAQYGGKQDHGTIDALYHLISHIQTKKSEWKVVYCVMLDFETAYPSVSRPQLYAYLHEQGIQGQSSAPSPRLYAIFLGSLLQKLREHFPTAQCTGAQWIGALAYVDDLCLCADSVEELNKTITVAQHWAEDHRAKINYGAGKSEIIVFNETYDDKTSRGQTPWIAKARFPYPHDKEVRKVDHFKYLGCTLDSNLDMNKQCTDMMIKQQSAMHYRQQVTLTIWKAIVHVHSTTHSILLTSTQQIQRVQNALDESLAECMGLSDGPILQTALNADCRLLPTRLQQAIELCSLHAKLVDQYRPAAQIHKSLISAPLIRTASLTERMRCAHITPNAVHLWGVPPTSPSHGHRVNRPQPFHQSMSLKTLMKIRKNELTTLACTQQRRMMLQLAHASGNSPSCPMQHYITATLSDLHWKKLNAPAP